MAQQCPDTRAAMTADMRLSVNYVLDSIEGRHLGIELHQIS